MFTKTFTDLQGTTHTAAVFHVATMNSTVRNSHNYSYSYVNDEESEKVNNNRAISYTMYYWRNQAAEDANHTPYLLANNSPSNTTFNIDERFLSNNPEYDNLTPIQIVEKHCQEVVLNDVTET